MSFGDERVELRGGVKPGLRVKPIVLESRGAKYRLRFVAISGDGPGTPRHRLSRCEGGKESWPLRAKRRIVSLITPPRGDDAGRLRTQIHARDRGRTASDRVSINRRRTEGPSGR